MPTPQFLLTLTFILIITGNIFFLRIKRTQRCLSVMSNLLRKRKKTDKVDLGIVFKRERREIDRNIFSWELRTKQMCYYWNSRPTEYASIFTTFLEAEHQTSPMKSFLWNFKNGRTYSNVGLIMLSG